MAVQNDHRVSLALEFDLPDQTPTPLDTHFWTGEGNIPFTELPPIFQPPTGSGIDSWQGTEFNENSLVSLSPIQTTAGSVPARLQGEIIIGELADVQRNAVLERDLGPLPVNVHMISKNTSGAWTRRRTFEGRTGLSSLIDGKWNFTVEQRDHDKDRKETRIWSHESMYARKYEYGSGNTKRTVRNARGFEFLQSLAQGEQVQWPN